MRQGLMQPPAGQTPVEAGPAAEQLPEEAAEDQGGPEESATPEEQAQYDDLMGTLFGLIHGEKTRSKVLDRLKAGKDNIGQSVGEMSMTLFEGVESNIEKQGGTIPDSVKMEVGEDLVAELVQMAVLAKLVPDEDEAIGQTMNAAIDVFASAYGNARREAGKVDPAAMQGELENLKGAAQSRFGGGQPPSQPTAMSGAVKQAGEQM